MPPPPEVSRDVGRDSVADRNVIRRFHGQRDQTWRTPPDVYAALNAEFAFTLDPCPHYRDHFDGLARSWDGERVFCNPPYRRGQIELWLAKAREADVVVYLLPSRTGAKWWADALRADEIRFIRGRLKFGGSKINAPEWSVILIYRSAKAVAQEIDRIAALEGVAPRHSGTP